MRIQQSITQFVRTLSIFKQSSPLSTAKETNMKIRLACVPEQVNIPIQLASEKKLFEKYQIEVEVKWVPEGTGKMIEMLEKGEADIALTVADATIVARNNHRQIQIAGCWVPSPLVWAIATTPNNSRYRDMKQFWDHQQNSGVNNLRVGISRPGSGSQTMASYMAMLNDIKVSSTASNLSFSAANNFVGLRNGVNNDAFDLFLWETFTTKPFFDSGELYKLGDVETPWPAFVFTTNSHQDLQLSHAIRERLFPALYESSQLFVNTKEESIERIMKEFHHTREDAELWFSRVHYSSSPEMTLDRDQMQRSLEILKSIGLIQEKFEFESLWEKENPIITTH